MVNITLDLGSKAARYSMSHSHPQILLYMVSNTIPCEKFQIGGQATRAVWLDVHCYCPYNILCIFIDVIVYCMATPAPNAKIPTFSKAGWLVFLTQNRQTVYFSLSSASTSGPCEALQFWFASAILKLVIYCAIHFSCFQMKNGVIELKKLCLTPLEMELKLHQPNPSEIAITEITFSSFNTFLLVSFYSFF